MTAPRAFSLCALTTALISACGGGGTDRVTPPVSVATQQPPPSRDPSAFGPMGLTQLRSFFTLGFVYRYAINSDGSDGQGPATPDATETIGLGYLSADRTYELETPLFAVGRLEPFSADSQYTVSRLSESANPNMYVYLFRPGPENTEQSLTHTSRGGWYDTNFTYTALPEARRSESQGLFAYGVPTATGDVPSIGGATYKALASGMTNVFEGRRAFSGGTPGAVEGDVQMAIDYSTGDLSGRLRLGLMDWGYLSIGEYRLTDFVHSAGATAFSGRFAVPGSVVDGTFEGIFTGPQAAEVMVRWKAPFLHPQLNVWGTMFGIWIGKQ
jgi:hypothetical protein